MTVLAIHSKMILCPHEPTPEEEFFSETHFSRLLPPLKPYYNPVNLEKARTRVKQKEFIQRISGAPAWAHTAHQRSSAPRGDFLVRVASVGSPGPRLAATYAEPLPPLYRIRRASAA